MRHGPLSPQVVEDSAGAAGMKDGCGSGRVYPKQAGQPARQMPVQHQHWYSLVAVVAVDPGMDHQRMREGATGTIVAHRRLYMAELLAVYSKEPGSIGVGRELQEAGRDMCRETIARGLRRELGWGRGAEVKRMNYGSGADPKIDPVLDTGTAQAAAEVG